MTESKIRLLIVEDDPQVRELLLRTLEAQGYQCSTCGNGLEALRLLRRALPDLLILDRILPGRDGLTVLRRLREISRLPVLLLTSLKSEDDKVEGLEAGADDYLSKPFSLRELLARVRALLRRDSVPAAGGVLEIGGLRMDLNGRRAWAKASPESPGESVPLDPAGAQEGAAQARSLELTPLEFKVLACLCLNAGQVISRDELIEMAWGVDYEGYDRAVDTLVKRLRRKLDLPGLPRIETARGQGYFIAGETA